MRPLTPRPGLPDTDSLYVLPERKAKAVRREFPDTAEDWIADFGDLVRRCCDRWSLTLEGTAEAGLPINVVFFARQAGGEPVVLKVGHPHPELATEMIYLRRVSSPNLVTLIDADEGLGAILMKRILPGTLFRAVEADRADVALPVFGKLAKPEDSVPGLPTYRDWIDKAFRTCRARLAPSDDYLRHVDRAERLYTRFEGETTHLLHGDLHHENLLLDPEGGWVAIDPKGVIGPRIMECGRFMGNFIVDEVPDGDPGKTGEVLWRRCEVMATVMERGPAEVLAAGYIDLVLGTTWTVNAGGEGSVGRTLMPVFADRLNRTDFARV